MKAGVCWLLWWKWAAETTPKWQGREVSGCYQFYASTDSELMLCIATWKFCLWSVCLTMTFHRKRRYGENEKKLVCEGMKQNAWLTWLLPFLWHKPGGEAGPVECLLPSFTSLRMCSPSWVPCLFEILGCFLFSERSVFFAGLYPSLHLSGGSDVSDDGEEATDPLISHNTFYRTKHLTSHPPCSDHRDLLPLGSSNIFALHYFPKTISSSKRSTGQLCLKCEWRELFCLVSSEDSLRFLETPRGGCGTTTIGEESWLPISLLWS